jgi:hypothetical protein
MLWLYSAFGKSLCTYKSCWKWRPRASIQAWTRLILFANTFCRSACEMFLMYAVTAVFNSSSVCGWSRYTADLATYRSLRAQRLSERIVLYTYSMWCTINMISLYNKRHGITNISCPWSLETRAIQYPRKVTAHLWPTGMISLSENISHISCRLEPYYAARNTIRKWKQGQSVWSFRMGAGYKSAAEEWNMSLIYQAPCH